VAAQIKLTGSVINMSVVDWATMHIENATDATFTNFTFSGNVGAIPPEYRVLERSLDLESRTKNSEH